MPRDPPSCSSRTLAAMRMFGFRRRTRISPEEEAEIWAYWFEQKRLLGRALAGVDAPESNALSTIAEGMHEAAVARIEAHKSWVPLTVRDAGGLAEDLWVNGVSYERIQKVIELQRANKSRPTRARMARFTGGRLDGTTQPLDLVVKRLMVLGDEPGYYQMTLQTAAYPDVLDYVWHEVEA